MQSIDLMAEADEVSVDKVKLAGKLKMGNFIAF
jgi:hypothetical protein